MKRRRNLLAPLTALCSSTSKWRWTDVEQKAFDLIKSATSKDVLLSYPDFTTPFDIHLDASKHQLGWVISQGGKPVAFYSYKLNPAQQRYTTTERELLSVVKTLKDCRNILLGQQVVVHTVSISRINNSTRIVLCVGVSSCKSMASHSPMLKVLLILWPTP